MYKTMFKICNVDMVTHLLNRQMMMTWYFMSLSTLFKSYQDHGSVIKAVCKDAPYSQEFCLQWDSNSGPCNPRSKEPTTSPHRHFRKKTEVQCLICLFVLRFNSLINPMGSCRTRSVYLTTLTSIVHILSP